MLHALQSVIDLVGATTHRRIVAQLALFALHAGNASANENTVSIVLVHGAFVDGSGWKAVDDLLSETGCEVLVTQHSTATPDGDVAAVTRVIEPAKLPVVLAGHSYGGMIITQAGIHPKVTSLVHVAAHAPEVGESVAKPAQVAAFIKTANAAAKP